MIAPLVLIQLQAALTTFDQSETILEPSISIAGTHWQYIVLCHHWLIPLDVFEAVQSGSVKYGVVPFENSTNGSVVYTLDLMIDREKFYPNVNVCGEAYIDVHHCLLGYIKDASKRDEATESGTATPTIHAPNPKSPRARPRSDLRHVRRIYSHPQAFGQCEAFLGTYLKGVERQEVSSTSKAAEMVAADASRTTAAISSRLAADVHRLKFLAEHIEDHEDNMTRFFILHKSASTEPFFPAAKVSTDEQGQLKEWKSLIAFRVDHQSSGALAKALSVFGLHGLNLTSINSRPSREHPWHYVFLVEFSDKRDGDGSCQVRRALERLSERTQSWKWLGSWIDQGIKGPSRNQKLQNLER